MDIVTTTIVPIVVVAAIMLLLQALVGWSAVPRGMRSQSLTPAGIWHYAALGRASLSSAMQLGWERQLDGLAQSGVSARAALEQQDRRR